MDGAEPYAAMGDSRGALVLHGFTGNPQSVRGVAMALADAGLTVELPLLPGHGTEVADMLPTRWNDWADAVEEEYTSLAARCDGVVVAGLSMGGLLALWLAQRHPEIAGLVLVNPMVLPPDDSLVALAQSMVEAGEELAPGIASDIAKEGVTESSYAETPLRPIISLFAAAAEVAADVESVACPSWCSPASRTTWSTLSRARSSSPGSPGPWSRSNWSGATTWPPWTGTSDEIEARTVEFATSVLPAPG